MKKSTTKKSQRVTLTLLKGGEGESGSAYSPFGPMRADLITLRRTNQDQELSVLLNYLERKMLELNIKSLKVLNTLNTDTTHLVEPMTFGNPQVQDTTKICEECGNDLVAEGERECLDCLKKSMIPSNH